MEGIQVILVQKESIDDQQPGQEEQYSVQFFQTKEIQVSQENPANIPDVEKQFLSNQHQHSVLEKLNTKCTKGSQPECQVRVQFAELLKSIIPQVDNERATQLHKLFFRLRKNEITGENFLRLVKDIVGCQLLTEAVEKVQIQFEGGNQVGGVMEEDANCSATLKANEVKRMVNEILHTYAMNVAAQAAVGGNDLTSKWKLMAKKAPLKHDKRIGAMSNAQLNEQMIYMSSQTSPRKSGDGQESKEKGTKNTFQGRHCLMSQKFVNPISTKDIVAVLERDRQMTNSRFGYCLYERLNAKASAV